MICRRGRRGILALRELREGARRSRARAERARFVCKVRNVGEWGGEEGCLLLGEGGARKRIGGEGEARGDGSAADKKMQFYHNKNYKKLSTKNVLFGVYF